MNTRKKIIYTLRSADKASVERLMSEAAKMDEVFAKARERAEKGDGYTEAAKKDEISEKAGEPAEKGSEYTEVTEGTEQYNPKIKIFHTASTAAASVLLVAGIWGAVHLLKNDHANFEHHIGNNNITDSFTISEAKTSHDENSPENNANVTTVTITGKTDVSPGAAVTTNAEGSGTSESVSSTTTVTTTAANEKPDVQTTTEAKPTDSNVSGEYIRDKSVNSVYNYNSFSADFTLNKKRDNSPLYRYSEGTIKIDNSSMTGEMDQTIYASDGRFYCDERHYYLNDKFVYAGDYGGGNVMARITDMRNELPSDSVFDRVYYKEYAGFSQFTSGNLNDSVWEVTGERTENGRKIVSVNVRYDGDSSGSSFTADIDAETGICLAYDRYLDNELIESFRVTDIRFDNEAAAPPDSHEVREFLENNGYASGMLENFSDYSISDLN